jgi:hypothetical protein
MIQYNMATGEIISSSSNHSLQGDQRSSEFCDHNLELGLQVHEFSAERKQNLPADLVNVDVTLFLAGQS